MALPINVREILAGRVVENARVEYKGGWNPEPVLHTICAFANDIDNWGGGYIIIGVDEEHGRPVLPPRGLNRDELDGISQQLLHKCMLIRPRYLPVIDYAVHEGRQLMVIWAPGGPERPYRCPVAIPASGEARSGSACYVRRLSSTMRATPAEERELFMLSENLPYDDRPHPRASVGDLQPGLIAQFLHAVGSGLYERSLTRPVQEVAEDMRLLGGPLERRSPLNVGLMFFNDRPDGFFPYARIELVDKPDPTGIGMTERIFSGPLDRQLRDALGFIGNYIIAERVSKVAGQAEATRCFNYPLAAVEEVIVNAVYHKSYQIGEPVTITVTPQSMEVTSLPGPDRTISDEDLRDCRLQSRRYRNRRIGDFLKELRLAEGRNTGIPTILRSMQANGSDPPCFVTDTGRTHFTVVLPVHKAFLPAAGAADQAQVRPGHPGSDSADQFRARLCGLLERMGPCTAAELALALGQARVTRHLAQALLQLLTDGSAELTAPAPGSAGGPRRIRLSATRVQ